MAKSPKKKPLRARRTPKVTRADSPTAATAGESREAAELLKCLAVLRREMSERVVRSKIGKREHTLALYVWGRIEAMRPAFTPAVWVGLEDREAK